MTTLVVSDLHLGSHTDVDVLRKGKARKALARAIREHAVTRVVLLGDTLELRHGPVADAIETARPALEAIGDALRPGTEVVLVPGNHDHALIGPWLERRALDREPPLGLAHVVVHLGDGLGGHQAGDGEGGLLLEPLEQLRHVGLEGVAEEQPERARVRLDPFEERVHPVAQPHLARVGARGCLR